MPLLPLPRSSHRAGIAALAAMAWSSPGWAGPTTAPSETATASAESVTVAPRRLILLIGPRRDPVFMRLRAELRSLGFVVEVAGEGTAIASPRDVETVARGLAAVAAIQVDRAGEQVTLWTADRTTGRMAPADRWAIEPDPALVALHAVEALRTSLIDVGTLVPERPSPTARADELRTEERRARLSLEVPPSPLGASFGPAVADSTGRIGPSWHLLASAHWMPHPVIGMEAIALVPLTVARWNEAEGSTRFTFGLVALGARVRPLVARTWSADAGAGVGAALVHGEGVPAGDGFSGNRRDSVVATPFVRVGSRVAIAPSFWLRADLAAAIALPRIVYTVADRTQETWGWPLVLGSIGLEVGSR